MGWDGMDRDGSGNGRMRTRSLGLVCVFGAAAYDSYR